MSRRKTRLHARFDASLLQAVDDFASLHELSRTWVLEQAARLLLELVEARKRGDEVLRVSKSGEASKLEHLYSVRL